MFNFCKDNIKGINFIYPSKAKVDATWAKFAKRLDNIKIIPGTRSFKKFIPITPNEIGVKFCSEDQYIFQSHNFGNGVSVPKSLNLQVLEYVCCTYGKNLWIGLITDIDMEEKDAKIKFLQPSLASNSFVWPQGDDLCWVPFSNIHCKTNVPLAIPLGQTCMITDEDMNTIKSFSL